MENSGGIIIYQAGDDLTHIEVKIEDETVWLSQQQMEDLYQTGRTNVVEHIKHIYEEGELDEQTNLSELPTDSSRMKQRGCKKYTIL